MLRHYKANVKYLGDLTLDQEELLKDFCSKYNGNYTENPNVGGMITLNFQCSPTQGDLRNEEARVKGLVRVGLKAAERFKKEDSGLRVKSIQ